MGTIGRFVAKEIREAAPAAVFFLFLFHMVALTRVVSLGDYSLAALRATTATIGALLVAKAILVAEALPIARHVSGPGAARILWKTFVFGAVVLLFRLVEELVPLAARHGGLPAGARAMAHEVSWPLFWVMTLWVLGGLLLYCLAAELVRALGPEKSKALLFSRE